MLRVHFIGQKKGFHEDENMSVSLCNYKMHTNNLVEHVVFSGKQVKESKSFMNDSFCDALSDVKKLYIDNLDRPHTNLYYSTLRLWFAGIKTIDMYKIIKHGCLLNLIFFAFSFLFLYKLLRKLFDDELVIITSLFVAFVNTGSISNTLFLRPYQQQETFLILFTYIFVQLYLDIKRNNFLPGKSEYFTKILLIALTLLTGYFVTIYVLMFFFLFHIYAKKYNIESYEQKIFWLFIGSVVTARLLFSGYFYGFSSGRAGEAFSQFNINFLVHNVFESLIVYFEILLRQLFPLPVMLFIFASTIYFYKKCKLNDAKFIIPLCCLCWSFIAIFLSTIKAMRYAMACFPLFVLLLPIIINKFSTIIKNISAFSLILFYGAYVFIYGNSVIENINADHKKYIEDIKNDVGLHTVIFIFQEWEYSIVLHLLNNENTYEFCYSLNSFHKILSKYNELVVLFSRYRVPEKDLTLYLPDNWIVVECYKINSVFRCKIKRK